MSLPEQVVDIYPNGTQRVVVGEIVRVASTKKLEKSQANLADNFAGTIGAVASGSVAPNGPDVAVVLSGRTFVLLETLLTPLAGQVLWLSASVEGRATNIQPSGDGNFIFPIGTIKNADGYARTGGVIGDVNSLDSVYNAAIANSTGASGVSGATGATGATGAAIKYAMFFGLTAGTGMAGTDYAATVAVKTGAGTGRVPFPQNGPAAGIVRVDGSSFTLPDVGTYAITFRVHTTEPGQLQLELAGTAVANSTTVDMNPTSGGHLLVGNCLLTTVAINQVLAVINPDNNSPALTITPADGASTHANAQSITILRIA